MSRSVNGDANANTTYLPLMNPGSVAITGVAGFLNFEISLKIGTWKKIQNPRNVEILGFLELPGGFEPPTC